jgi:SpoVK/Ycf46/Vps4 family AAA+-type ATPase
VPTLWLSNEIGQMDPAFLRRFDCILELRTPPLAVRRRILEKSLEGLPVRAPWLATMATDERLTPAHIERAARVARLSGFEGADEVEHAVSRILHNSARGAGPSGRGHAERQRHLRPAVLELQRRPRGHRDLAGAPARETRGALTGSICLYGPPGTGKTAFAHHLAERLGRRLLVKRASDILGPFVGQTEANIAEMFREARAESAVLLLDEADSFFQDRRGASQHWEVTQVNELLVQMESFDGLFICSTNLFENLDQASLRRFTLKIRFDSLRPEQRWELFGRTLQSLGHEAPAETAPTLRRGLDALENLTPGDFATIRRQATMLGSAVDAGALLRALERESRAKPNARRGPLGFAN